MRYQLVVSVVLLLMGTDNPAAQSGSKQRERAKGMTKTRLDALLSRLDTDKGFVDVFRERRNRLRDRTQFIDGELVPGSSPPLDPSGSGSPPIIVATRYDKATVTVRVSSPGGGPSCSVRQITLQYGPSGRPLTSQTVWLSMAQQGVLLPLSVGGYNSIYAVGVCQGSNVTTPVSKGLSVYSEAGIQMPLPPFYLSNNGVTIKCTSAKVGQNGTIGGVTYVKRDRAGIESLLSNNTNNPELATTCTSGVTDMSGLFVYAYDFNQNIASWDTSQVGDMSYMFAYATSFDQDIGSWDTSQARDMSYMFLSSQSFNQDIGNWDTSQITSMTGTFFFALAFNQNIGSWDTSKVTSLDVTFTFATGFNQPIGAWNTSQVTNLFGTFAYAYQFDQDIGSWDTGNVEDFSYAFFGDIAFNQPIGSWDTSSATEMRGMFVGAESFNQDISAWDISKVTSLRSIFDSAKSFNQPIGNWNTSQVQDMKYTFFHATSFNQDLTTWCVVQIGAEPKDFANGSSLQQSNMPMWGQPC